MTTPPRLRHGATANRIDLECDEFERRFRAGDSPRIETYLDSADPADRRRLFRELLLLELELHLEQGRRPLPAEFKSRFVNESDVIDAAFGQVLASSSQIAVFTPGTTFGRFRIERLLGTGGMGTVYLAFDPRMDQLVALKIPKIEAGDDECRKRFLREARIAASLKHSGICPVYDVGEQNGRLFVTMKYIDGHTVSAHCQPGSLLSPPQAAALVCKIATAVAAAHAAGIVHRDLKPENVMIDGTGRPVLMDFGLARPYDDSKRSRLTQTGTILGSPAYMSPEQVQGKVAAIGPPTDVYSLGVVLYELLTGRVPFDGPVGVVMAKVLTRAAPQPHQFRPELDGKLEAICERMMAKRIADRYASMEEVAAALTEWHDRRLETSAPVPASGSATGVGQVEMEGHSSAGSQATLRSTKSAGAVSRAESRAERFPSLSRGGLVAFVLILGVVLVYFAFLRPPTTAPTGTSQDLGSRPTFDPLTTFGSHSDKSTKDSADISDVKPPRAPLQPSIAGAANTLAAPTGERTNTRVSLEKPLSAAGMQEDAGDVPAKILLEEPSIDGRPFSHWIGECRRNYRRKYGDGWRFADEATLSAFGNAARLTSNRLHKDPTGLTWLLDSAVQYESDYRPIGNTDQWLPGRFLPAPRKPCCIPDREEDVLRVLKSGTSDDRSAIWDLGPGGKLGTSEWAERESRLFYVAALVIVSDPADCEPLFNRLRSLPAALVSIESLVGLGKIAELCDAFDSIHPSARIAAIATIDAALRPMRDEQLRRHARKFADLLLRIAIHETDTELRWAAIWYLGGRQGEYYDDGGLRTPLWMNAAYNVGEISRLTPSLSDVCFGFWHLPAFGPLGTLELLSRLTFLDEEAFQELRRRCRSFKELADLSDGRVVYSTRQGEQYDQRIRYSAAADMVMELGIPAARWLITTIEADARYDQLRATVLRGLARDHAYHGKALPKDVLDWVCAQLRHKDNNRLAVAALVETDSYEALPVLRFREQDKNSSATLKYVAKEAIKKLEQRQKDSQ